MQSEVSLRMRIVNHSRKIQHWSTPINSLVPTAMRLTKVGHILTGSATVFGSQNAVGDRIDTDPVLAFEPGSLT